jgi:methionyl-tRNA synthetase
MEKYNVEITRFILADDPPRTARSRRGFVMFDNKNIKGGNAAIGNIAQRRAGAAVNQADGKMPQNINDMRANPLFYDGSQF